MTLSTYRPHLAELEDENSNPVHTPILPADVRPGDQVTAQIYWTQGEETRSMEVMVWKLSPIGVEFVCDRPEIDLGNTIDLRITLNKQVCEFSGMVIAAITQTGNRRLIGIRWCNEQPGTTPLRDRRDSRRWTCGNEFLPMGMVANPVRFDDFIHFRVKDLSRTGMQLHTSLRNRLLVPGMTLEGVITFPMVGQATVRFRIKNARVFTANGRSDLVLGTELVEPTPQVLETIGQYVLQFGSAETLEEIRKSGLPVRSVSPAIEYSFVKTAADYREVLHLRHACYSAAGKVSKDAAPEETGDRYDTHARIMTARYRGKLVGSLRIVFPEADTPLEHEEFFALPAHFPRRDEMVEVSRVCTDPEYRGFDLLMGMFRRCTLTILQSRRRYTLGSSTKKLLPFYRRVGLIDAKVPYQHTGLGGEEHYTFIGDNYGVVVGKDISPIVWNIMYAELSSYLSRQDVVSFGAWVNVRLAFYRMLRPAIMAWYSRRDGRSK